MSLHIVDYVIFLTSVVGSFCIGIYYAFAKDKNNTTEDYLVASRSMNIVPVSISFIVSFFSAISMLGNSSEAYYFGFEVMFGIIGWSFGYVLTAYISVPLFHPLKLTSVHHYLLMRYNTKWLMYAGTLLQTVAFCFINGVVLLGPAIMLKSMADIPVWISILGTGILSTIYTAVGGFKAVIWSDVFQAVIIFIGMIVINILGLIEVGGFGEVWSILRKYDRHTVNFSFSIFERSTVWGFIFGFTIASFSFFSTLQISVQRICSLPTARLAKLALLLGCIPYTFVVFLTCISGMMAFVYFAKLGCDPLFGGQISSPNQILVYYIQSVLNYPAIQGLFIASIFCGTLSNLSSFYSSICAMIWDDIIEEKLKDKHLSERRKTLITKSISFVSGVFSTLCGFVVSMLGGTLLQTAVIIGSSTIAPVAITVFLGALSPKSSTRSASLAAIVGFSITLWLNFGSYFAGTNMKSLLPQETGKCNLNQTYGINETLLQAKYSASPIDDIGIVAIDQQFTTVPLVSNFTEITEEEDDIFWPYTISFLWFTPIGLLSGITVGIILSFIPGFSNKDEVDQKYLFPFVRFILHKSGYLKFEAKENGVYTIDQNDNKISNL